MIPFTQSEAEDKHFPLPHSTLELLEYSYDPTYGEQSPSVRRVVVCRTCAALVQDYDTAQHADWHESGAGPE